MLLKKQFVKANIPLNDEDVFNSPAIRFRKKFNVGEIKNAVLFVCGLGYGYYYINGEKVADDLLTAPVSDYQKTVWYNKYDVTHLVQEGENIFAAIVGNGFYNENFPSGWDHNKAPWRDVPKLFASLWVDGKEVFTSDESFACKADECIYFNQLRSGEYWDFNKLEEWQSLDFDDTDWKRAWIDEPEKTGELVECLCEPIRECAEYKTQRIIKYKDKYIFDIGQNISGYIRFKGCLAKGQEITIFHGETIEPDGNLWQDETTVLCNLNAFTKEVPFQTDKIIGNSEYIEWSPIFTYHGFRYVEISGLTEEPTTDMVTGIFVHQDIKRTSTFECSDEILNKIYEMGILSTYSNMHYALTDCPTREKLGWLNDAAASVDQILLNFRSEKFYAKWIRDIMETIKEDGAVSGIAPTPNWGYTPGGVCTIGFAEIPYATYQKTRDLDIPKYTLPYIEKHFAFYDNLVKGDTPGFDLGDWTGITNRETPIPIIEKFICLRFLRVMIAFRKALGKDYEDLNEKQEYYRQKVEELSFKNGKPVCENQTLLSMLIVEGFDNGTLEDLLINVVLKKPEIDCGMMGIQYLYKALSICKREDLIVELLTNENSFYKRWIQEGETTLVESFDLNPYTRSKNHHMFSNVLSWFYRGLLGVEYDEELGAKKIIIKPCNNFSLQYAKGSIQLDEGTIFVSVYNNGTNIEYTIKVDGNLAVEYQGECIKGQKRLLFEF